MESILVQPSNFSWNAMLLILSCLFIHKDNRYPTNYYQKVWCFNVSRPRSDAPMCHVQGMMLQCVTSKVWCFNVSRPTKITRFSLSGFPFKQGFSCKVSLRSKPNFDSDWHAIHSHISQCKFTQFFLLKIHTKQVCNFSCTNQFKVLSFLPTQDLHSIKVFSKEFLLKTQANVQVITTSSFITLQGTISTK